MTGKDIFLIATAGLCVAGGWAHYFSARSLAGAPLPRAMVAVRDAQPVATPPTHPTVDHPPAPAPAPASNTFASLLVADPEDQDARAATLLLNLCHAGRFAAAFDLIGQAPAGLQAGFYRIVFKCWAQSQPRQALQSLAAIADPQARSAAWRAAADGWNVNDPAGLVACAFSLPAGGDRDYALGLANARIISPGDVEHSVLYQRLISAAPTVKMPPVAHNEVDARAARVISDWIKSLPATPAR